MGINPSIRPSVRLKDPSPTATEKCHFLNLKCGPIILYPQIQSHDLSLLRLSQQDCNFHVLSYIKDVIQTFHADFSGATAADHLNVVCLTPFLYILMQNLCISYP